jgi:hypothetical protein
MRWTYGGEVAALLGTGRRTLVTGSYSYGIDPRYGTPLYPRLATSAALLLGRPDYADYLGAERVELRLLRALAPLRTSVEVGLTSERHGSVPARTSFDLVDGAWQLPNAPVAEGYLRAAHLRVVVGARRPGRLGLTGRDRLALEVERGLTRGLASDFAFTRLAATGELELDTFFRRRLLPNTLYLRADAGLLLGADRVRQRYGTVDARLGPYAPFGALRTRAGRPYEGERHLAVTWEHTFRTVPFERLGLGWAAERGWSLLVHGGHAAAWAPADTWIPADAVPPVPSSTDGWHHEVGIGLSGLLGLARLDLTTRLDAPGLALSLAVARMF